jgi:hypothetical protein
LAAQLPLPTLLSQVLVAYTIEFDNEAEHRLPHRTTSHGDPGLRNVWLVSMAMWLNCMQYVTDEPMLVSELEKQARTSTNLDGMRRWGYVFLESESGDLKRRSRDLTIRATRRGQRAQEVWRPLAGVIEDRWRDRFGAAEVDRLRAALTELAAQSEVDLPDCMPILHYGLFSGRQKLARREPAAEPDLPLAVLLARVLLGFALRFEQYSKLSLAICANLLRVLDTGGVLVKADLAVVAAAPGGGRFKAARLTDRGQTSQWAYTDRIGQLEARASERLGAGAVGGPGAAGRRPG